MFDRFKAAAFVLRRPAVVVVDRPPAGEGLLVLLTPEYLLSVRMADEVLNEPGYVAQAGAHLGALLLDERSPVPVDITAWEAANADHYEDCADPETCDGDCAECTCGDEVE